MYHSYILKVSLATLPYIINLGFVYCVHVILMDLNYR